MVWNYTLKQYSKTRIILFIVFILLVLVGFLFLLFATKFFQEEEAEFCKNFLLNNKAVNDHFGQIKSIKLVRGGGLSWSSSGERNGTCHYRVKGTMSKNIIKVRWEEKNNKMEITRVWMRQGLAGTQTFYPHQMGDVYILPSNIWDGIISLAAAAICFLFYFGFKNRKKWATFFSSSLLVMKRCGVLYKLLLY